MNNAERQLIYIHGFRSSPLTEKGQMFQRTFPSIVLASYDTLHPDQGFRDLDAIVREAMSRRPILIGSSLGGFWAHHFASKYALACVLLNPCMHPETTLRPYLGPVENLYTGERGHMEESDLHRYASFSCATPDHCIVLHERGDELIPYQQSVAYFNGRAKLVLIEGGSHRFEHLDAAITEIQSLLTDRPEASNR